MRVNKQIVLLFAFIILANFSFAQSQKSFDRLVVNTNAYLLQYSKLSPFGSKNFIALKESNLPSKNIKDLKTHFEADAGHVKDSISEYNLLLEFQGLITENIERIISHNTFKDNTIKEQISDAYDLSIVVSDDKKLYHFSLDEKTGGSYRSRISITHYTGDSIDTTVLENYSFNTIETIETKEGTKYVLTGSVRGCSYCFETFVMLVKLENGVFKQDFVYAVNSRSWEEGVSYDSESKTITVDYITDDLTTECHCLNYATLDAQENDYNTYDEDIEPIEKRCHCTFQFNGLNFELTKEDSSIFKE